VQIYYFFSQFKGFIGFLTDLTAVFYFNSIAYRVFRK